jgi:hypothetical protein
MERPQFGGFSPHEGLLPGGRGLHIDPVPAVAQLLDDAVHGVLPHHPIGCELPSSHGQHPCRPLENRVFARHTGRPLRRIGEERAEPGPGDPDVVNPEAGIGKQRVDGAEEVDDVGLSGGNRLGSFAGIRVGGADVGIVTPGQRT